MYEVYIIYYANCITLPYPEADIQVIEMETGQLLCIERIFLPDSFGHA
jgi:hypothetical protein